MVYIKTIFSAANEVKYIKLHLAESLEYVDKVIVCEFDHTHTGKSRELIFSKYMQDGTFTEEELDRIIYLPGRVGKNVKRSDNNAKTMHNNEKLFRGYFARHIKLDPNDIIISVDADEIIFKRYYEYILSHFKDKKANPVLQLKLYQFFYKPTYLWVDKIVIAPTVCKVKHNRFRYPAQWRQEGEILDEIVGCHFSWQLTITEMIEKLSNYAHAADYGHLAKREILVDAVRNKKYPFNPSVDFRIREIDFDHNPEFYPEHFKDIVFENAEEAY